MISLEWWPRSARGWTASRSATRCSASPNPRNSQAEFVAVPSGQLTAKPAGVTVGRRRWSVRRGYHRVRRGPRRRVEPGDTVAVAGAAGGVGSIAVQLAKRAGATVLGIAGPSNDEWLDRARRDPGQLRRRPGESAPCGGARRPDRRLPRLLRRRLRRARGDRAGHRTATGRHDHRFRGHRTVRRQGRGQCRRLRCRACWPSSRHWSPPASWRCRSPQVFPLDDVQSAFRTLEAAAYQGQAGPSAVTARRVSGGRGSLPRPGACR